MPYARASIKRRQIRAGIFPRPFYISTKASAHKPCANKKIARKICAGFFDYFRKPMRKNNIRLIRLIRNPGEISPPDEMPLMASLMDFSDLMANA